MSHRIGTTGTGRRGGLRIAAASLCIAALTAVGGPALAADTAPTNQPTATGSLVTAPDDGQQDSPATDGSADAAQAAPEPTAQPSVEPTAEPTSEASPEPAAKASSEPAPEPTAEPTSEPAPEPASEPAPAADAAPAPAPDWIDAIRSITASTQTVRDGGTLKLDAKWSLPKGTVAGTRFGLTVPDLLKLGTIPDFDLRDGSAVAATCTVRDAHVECTTTDYAVNHANVEGDLWLSVRAQRVESTGQVDVTVAPGVSRTLQLVVEPQPAEPQRPPSNHHNNTRSDYTPATSPKKLGRGVDTTRQTMAWRIEAPASARTEHGLVVHDSWADTGVRLDEGSLQVRCHAVHEGRWSTLRSSRDFSVAQTAHGMDLTITDAHCDGTYQVNYKTQLPSGSHQDLTVRNSATIKGLPEVHASQTWKPPAQLSKSGKVDSSHRRADWTVHLTAEGLGSGTATITDKPERMSLVPGSAKLRCEILGRGKDLPASAFAVTTDDTDAENHIITVAISDQSCRVDGGRYVLTYTTDLPRDATDGEQFQNSVTATSASHASTPRAAPRSSTRCPPVAARRDPRSGT
ncbi:hypothetical protein GCM10025865_11190 [Paraoerskovia sediminicola]|uniref:SDR-like Ig domain-containing protein n=1 Tax=Paraoerskovia sediminicola TaxID=1138587 RepID=A0ABN6XDI5_9CELL|nr:Ig-like domain-containing protein [Paraoerskovia sediminicola]BDZ41820.1 hypothetical protein GCM10025865_11190 [Paraoerskovia sediminicola]